jgi:hypothetical protein
MALGTEEPVPVRDINPTVPEPLAELVHSLLAKNPDHRPQTADEAAQRLRSIAGTLSGLNLPRREADSRDTALSNGSSRVAYAPIQVNARSDRDAPADPEATERSHSVASIESEPQMEPVRKQPAKPFPWVHAEVAAVLVACVGGGIVVLQNSGGSGAKTESPSDIERENKRKAEEEPRRVTPDEKQPGARCPQTRRSPRGSLRT